MKLFRMSCWEEDNNNNNNKNDSNEIVNKKVIETARLLKFKKILGMKNEKKKMFLSFSNRIKN